VRQIKAGQGDGTNKYQSIVIVGFGILAMKIFQGLMKCGGVLELLAHDNIPLSNPPLVDYCPNDVGSPLLQ
jgi:hypothetical protein